MTDAGKRPAAATVCGILDMLFGFFGISSLYYVKLAGAGIAEFNNVIVMIGSLFSLLLVIAGILLLMGRSLGLGLSIWYAYITMAVALVRSVYLLATGGDAGLQMGLVAVIISIAYPIIILAVLARNDDVKKFYSSR